MSNQIRDAAEVVKGIVEAVPVYEDLLQPAVREVGIALGTVAKTINIALAPVSLLVWGYDKIKNYTISALESRLSKIPPEQIITPSPLVAGPILEALRFAGHQEELRELYLNLLATSMDADIAHKAHPSFVNLLKQLTPDEARIISFLNSDDSHPMISVKAAYKDNNGGFIPVVSNFSLLPEQAGCLYADIGISYIENLARLGIILILPGTYITDDNYYKPLIEHSKIVTAAKSIIDRNMLPDYAKGIIRRTAFGKQFYEACVAYK